ncbi:FtsH protease activity modulator HflK [Desulfocurvus vexinensis]|uniref:FtsH protease activity modulator HflK n=1 Tax=Desulfocurvus vexinensis TaxID=399548 RepID=UPI000490C2B8|nr:FtsH protease activity modulator HflK [Desulfocurvus vexinensis]
MNWDWDKLQQQNKRQRPSGGASGPGLGDFGFEVRRLRQFNFPAGKFILLAVVVLWALSGLYIVNADEQGVVLRFGKFARLTESGLHYHLPFPIESVETPKVTQIHRVEIGFRGSAGAGSQARAVDQESLMLTGDENIVDVQFIVQYKIRDAKQYLFNVKSQHETVKAAAEAAMREVVGYNLIDTVLTTGKLGIQNDSTDLLQSILDRYESGIQVVAVQLQDVHPPHEVIDAFKDVASAREDKSRLINEADAYRNDLMPRARGQAAVLLNQAEAYKETRIRRAQGDAARYLAVLQEYEKARDVTKTRLYLETMETVLSNPELEKIIIDSKASGGVVPYLPLDRLPRAKAPASSEPQTPQAGGAQ